MRRDSVGSTSIDSRADAGLSADIFGEAFQSASLMTSTEVLPKP
jgi:hypothetical protein